MGANISDDWAAAMSETMIQSILREDFLVDDNMCASGELKFATESHLGMVESDHLYDSRVFFETIKKIRARHGKGCIDGESFDIRVKMTKTGAITIHIADHVYAIAPRVQMRDI